MSIREMVETRVKSDKMTKKDLVEALVKVCEENARLKKEGVRVTSILKKQTDSKKRTGHKMDIIYAQFNVCGAPVRARFIKGDWATNWLSDVDASKLTNVLLREVV